MIICDVVVVSEDEICGRFLSVGDVMLKVGGVGATNEPN